MTYRCIAEFVDIETGARVKPGALVSFDDPERAARLVAAGCIVLVEKPTATNEPAPEPAPKTIKRRKG